MGIASKIRSRLKKFGLGKALGKRYGHAGGKRRRSRKHH